MEIVRRSLGHCFRFGHGVQSAPTPLATSPPQRSDLHQGHRIPPRLAFEHRQCHILRAVLRDDGRPAAAPARVEMVLR